MKKLPEEFLQSLENVEGFDRKSFEDVHARDNRITSIRLNPGKVGGGFTIDDPRFTIHEKVPWSQYGFYLDQRSSFTFDPFFHAGCYY
ncbi:MAG: hypothetical protein ACJ749_09995, partial [Flavisolibacter sp.]